MEEIISEKGLREGENRARIGLLNFIYAKSMSENKEGFLVYALHTDNTSCSIWKVDWTRLTLSSYGGSADAWVTAQIISFNPEWTCTYDETVTALKAKGCLDSLHELPSGTFLISEATTTSTGAAILSHGLSQPGHEIEVDKPTV